MGVLSINGPSPIALLLGRGQAGEVKPMVTAADASEEGGTAAAMYTANLAKLIPGEALSLYAMGGNVQVPPEMADLRVWSVFCLAAAIIFRWLATKKPRSIWPQWSALAISIVSFILWIYGQNDWFLRWQIPENFVFIAKYALLFWVFVLPAVVGSTNKK